MKQAFSSIKVAGIEQDTYVLQVTLSNKQRLNIRVSKDAKQRRKREILENIFAQLYGYDNVASLSSLEKEDLILAIEKAIFEFEKGQTDNLY